MTISAIVFGCAGFSLSEQERAFFRDANPWGFILFSRNCDNPDQVRALVEDLRNTVGRGDAPVLIDQEGGRVQRLSPPHWPSYPPMRMFVEGYDRDPEAAERALYNNIRLIAADLHDLGITVNCLPVLDVPAPNAHRIIGDRAFGGDVNVIARLGRLVCGSLLDGGVLPVIKHMPGHGRAEVDSHLSLPVVKASRSDLENRDFVPFRALADMPLAMSAHVVYEAIDSERPATQSSTVIGEIIRTEFGFDGLLITDDLSMSALQGSLKQRLLESIEAGCDVGLHCNGVMQEMIELAEVAPSLTRGDRVLSFLRDPEPFDREQAWAELSLSRRESL